MEPVISDFGFARILASTDEQATTSSDVGPIRWMAVESIMERVYSTKSDVWSFGVTGNSIFHSEFN